MKAILAAALVAQAVIEAFNAPVPDELKMVAWGYIALRIVGKIAKFVFPSPDGGAWMSNDTVKGLAIAALLTAALAGPAMAEDEAAITDIRARAHVSVNGSWLTLKQAPQWSAGALGGAISYSLPRNVGLQFQYDHGFAMGDAVGEANFLRAEGTLKIYPIAPEVSQTTIFVGVGHSWFARDGADFETNDVKLVLSRVVIPPRVALFGLYARAFSQDDALADFDYAKVGLQFHAIGK